MKRIQWNRERTIQFLKISGIVLICTIALLYSFYYILNVQRFGENYSPDEGRYIELAKRILLEHRYSFWGEEPDAYVSPGYPLFLVACMSLFGSDIYGIDSIKFVQAILFAATVFLVFVLAYQITKKYSIGFIASALIALNGNYAFYTRRLLTEIFFVFTMMLFFVLFILSVQKEKKWLHFLSGMVFCISVFVRPLLFIVFPVLYLPHFIKNWKHWKEMFTHPLFFFLGFLLVGLPWWIRNIVTLHQFVFLATQTNPIYAGLARDPAALGLQDPGSMMGNIKLFFELLVARPLQTIHWMFFEKFNIIFRKMDEIVYLQTITVLLKDITVYVGLFGACRALLSKKYIWPAIAFFCYFLSTFAFVPTSRYALQYFPLLAIFAGYIIVAAFSNTSDMIFSKKKKAASEETLL